ncbi:hypothetical protein B0T10DRAFT_469387 [Thelonectria olida]|uniref:Uncharacterized protein n=1 Tax=Thelonectria olida TaxID=1576542 RepID=A0A9P8WK66_9HYPO|nr:hypothetical protein B0T10DRAFT_469387 [Thelonectria olida]
MSTPKLNLLDLPVDILNLILFTLLKSSEPILLCPCSSCPDDIDPLPVLLSHPSLHAIAAPLLFSVNQFVLDATGPHARHIRRRLEADQEASEFTPWEDGGAVDRAPASLLTTRDARRRMANLQVRFERLRAWVHDGFVPLLTDMVFKGSLEHLTIWVRTPEGEKGQQQRQAPRRTGDGTPNLEDDELAMFVRPPLEGLLRVLADPYLLTARLWVDRRRHLLGWCRFHPAGRGMVCGTLRRARIGAGAEWEDEYQEEPPAAAIGKHEEAEPDPEMVEVDWREVLKVVDPGRKDVMVADGMKRWY